MWFYLKVGVSDRTVRFLKAQDKVYAKVMIGIAEKTKILREPI